MTHRHSIKDYALLGLLALLWGVAYNFAKIAVETIPPLTMTAMRRPWWGDWSMWRRSVVFPLPWLLLAKSKCRSSSRSYEKTRKHCHR